MPFENVFTNSEAYAMFVAGLVLFPLMNNLVHCRDLGNRKRFYLTVPIPRWLGALILLIPRKHHGYRVHLFCLISQCVFVLSVAVFAVLSLMGIQLTESVQEILPECMCYFVFAVAAGAMIDSIIYDRNHPDEIADLLRKAK